MNHVMMHWQMRSSQTDRTDLFPSSLFLSYPTSDLCASILVKKESVCVNKFSDELLPNIHTKAAKRCSFAKVISLNRCSATRAMTWLIYCTCNFRGERYVLMRLVLLQWEGRNCNNPESLLKPSFSTNLWSIFVHQTVNQVSNQLVNKTELKGG